MGGIHVRHPLAWRRASWNSLWSEALPTGPSPSVFPFTDVRPASCSGGFCCLPLSSISGPPNQCLVLQLPLGVLPGSPDPPTAPLSLRGLPQHSVVCSPGCSLSSCHQALGTCLALAPLSSDSWAVCSVLAISIPNENGCSMGFGRSRSSPARSGSCWACAPYPE